MSIFLVLISDVCPDHLFVESNRGYKITSRPEILSDEIPGFPGESSRYRYCTLPFDIPDYIRYRVLRRNANADMHVIRHQVPFYYLTFFLFRQLPQYLAEMFADRSKYHLLPPLRDKDNVIFAIPLRMTKTLILFHLILLTLDRVRRIRLTVALGQTL